MISIHPASKKHLIAWLPYAFTITLLIGFIYGTIQQHIRTAANDPQIYLAENLATDLFNNKNPSAQLSGQSIDIASSVAPFVILYDSNGRAADGTGRLNDQLPSLPRGVYDYAQKHGEDRITWQPQKNVRVAVVVRYYQNSKHAGFVLAGKNLREIEHEENQQLQLSVIAWAVGLIGTLALTAIPYHPQLLRKITKSDK